MAGLIEYYLLFCLTTTIVFLGTVIVPIVNNLSEIYPKPKVLKQGSKTFLKIILSVLIFILAPVMFIIYLFPGYLERFTHRIFEELKKE